jgi:hypothetical protein
MPASPRAARGRGREVPEHGRWVEGVRVWRARVGRGVDPAGHVVAEAKRRDEGPAVGVLALAERQHRRHEHRRDVLAADPAALDVGGVPHGPVGERGVGDVRPEATADHGALGRAAECSRQVTGVAAAAEVGQRAGQERADGVEHDDLRAGDRVRR